MQHTVLFLPSVASLFACLIRAWEPYFRLLFSISRHWWPININIATSDGRHRLTNGEVKSSAPLMHLASSPDPDDTTRLDIRALSPHPVALMHPVIPPPRPPPPGTTPGSGRDEGKKGRTSFDRSDGVGSNCGAGTHGRGRRSSGLGLDRGAGDAASMCDMQAWACQLVFENSRGCRLARKHMEGRRLRLRSEKVR